MIPEAPLQSLRADNDESRAVTDKVKLHRRIANLARWEAQQAGSDLARQLIRLKQLKKEAERLTREIDALDRERLAAIADGKVDLQRLEGAGLLAVELDQAVQQYRSAITRQLESVARCRRALAGAQQKQRKTQDKHRESVRGAYLQKSAQESAELEGVYVANFGRRR